MKTLELKFENADGKIVAYSLIGFKLIFSPSEHLKSVMTVANF
ncbi:hypothetical protein [Paucisalibacillus sp. EB02]|nr:hypothetical protein [Paucisalibacillus sp. EB02]